jgi:uncharacterized tellurite resistance protein B-like protein
MLKTIQQFFQTSIQPAVGQPESAGTEHALQLATAALLIELTRADFKVEERERRMVENAIKQVFDVTAEETEELVRLAESEADKSLSIYDFTHLIDRSFSSGQKKRIIELLWRVAFSDSELEQHEEYLIRKVAKLLHVRHQDFIDAKLKARDDLRGQGGKEDKEIGRG